MERRWAKNDEFFDRRRQRASSADVHWQSNEAPRSFSCYLPPPPPPPPYGIAITCTHTKMNDTRTVFQHSSLKRSNAYVNAQPLLHFHPKSHTHACRRHRAHWAHHLFLAHWALCFQNIYHFQSPKLRLYFWVESYWFQVLLTKFCFGPVCSEANAYFTSEFRHPFVWIPLSSFFSIICIKNFESVFSEKFLPYKAQGYESKDVLHVGSSYIQI